MTITDFKNADALYDLLARYPLEPTFLLTGAAVEKFQVSMRRILNDRERKQRRRVSAIIGERTGECGNIQWRYQYEK